MTTTTEARLKLSIDGVPEDCTEARFNFTPLVYDATPPDAGSVRREMGPAGFCIAVTGASPILQAMVGDGTPHTVRITADQQVIEVPVVFTVAGTDLGEPWVFGKWAGKGFCGEWEDVRE